MIDEKLLIDHLETKDVGMCEDTIQDVIRLIDSGQFSTPAIDPEWLMGWIEEHEDNARFYRGDDETLAVDANDLKSAIAEKLGD